MSEFYSQPVQLNPPPEIEILAVYQATQQFYYEVQQRQEFELYCQWYEMTAEKNRQELEAMQTDINLMGWFYRGRRSPS